MHGVCACWYEFQFCRTKYSILPAIYLPWQYSSPGDCQEHCHRSRLPLFCQGAPSAHEWLAPPQLCAHCQQHVNSQGCWPLQDGWGTWSAPTIPPCILTWLQPHWTGFLNHQGVAVCKLWLCECRHRNWGGHSVQCNMAGSALSHHRRHEGLVQALQIHPPLMLQYCTPFSVYNTIMCKQSDFSFFVWMKHCFYFGKIYLLTSLQDGNHQKWFSLGNCYRG